MKMSLLDMIQDIMSDMNSDDVNSVADTPESLQVAQIIKSVYYEMISRREEWPHLRKMAVLSGLADASYPNYLKLPENVSRMDYLWYDVRKDGETRSRFTKLTYMSPERFLENANRLNLDRADVVEITGFDGIKYNIQNDKAPQYWTSFDDEYIILDSYNSVVEATVQGSKSQAQVYTIPAWTMTDNFVPDFPSEVFPGFLAEAKSACFLRITQQADEKSEQQAVRQARAMSQRNWRAYGGNNRANYGRRGAKGRVRDNPYFDKG